MHLATILYLPKYFDLAALGNLVLLLLVTSDEMGNPPKENTCTSTRKEEK
jgi:hypothetical protein